VKYSLHFKQTFILIGYIIPFLLVLSSGFVGCSFLSKSVGTLKPKIADPVIQEINGQTYWCLEEKLFTATLQEASRSCR